MRRSELLRDNLATIVVGIAVALVLAVSWGLLLRRGASARGALVARVHDGEGRTYLMPLDRDDRLEVETRYGTNVVEVADGAVSMAEANCLRESCCDAAPLRAPGAQIICLPHHLWIEVAAAGDPDATMDVTRAEGVDKAGDVDLVAR